LPRAAKVGQVLDAAQFFVINRVHPIDADEENMLDLSVAKFIVGASWCRKSGAISPTDSTTANNLCFK